MAAGDVKVAILHAGTDTELPAVEEPAETARLVGLRYYTDARPGIRRKRAGTGFSYVGPDGQTIRDTAELKRFRSLAIPPAWTDVWICPTPRGHIQATGRDAKGRKQYRYHAKWREVRDEVKYGRLIAFAEALPSIRDRTDADLAQHCLSREKVLATVVQLLDETAIRVGNAEYARANQSFGLTTLRIRHVKIDGSDIRFHFRAKSGKEQVVTVHSGRLARALRRCQDLPGQELFQYVEDGELRSVDSGDVNDYLREVTGEHFTAKDFRTWHGTVRAAQALYWIGPCGTQSEGKHNVTRAVESTAEHLGNTAAIARKSYIHPAIIDAYMEGTLGPTFDRVLSENGEGRVPGLHPEEAATLAVLRQQLTKELETQKAS